MESIEILLFCCQLLVNNDVKHPLQGDFLINDKNLFEGGEGRDDTEVGYANRIPLWLFGFTY